MEARHKKAYEEFSSQPISAAKRIKIESPKLSAENSLNYALLLYTRRVLQQLKRSRKRWEIDIRVSDN